MEILEKIQPSKEKPKQKSEQELEKEPQYNFESIKRSEKPIERLVLLLKEKIDKGEYDVLVGDDASGRIPTLIFRKILNARNRSIHPELSDKENEVITRFFAAGRVENKRQLEIAFKRKLKPIVRKRVLVITESLATGNSLYRMSEILEDLNIPFDVLSVTSEKERSYYGMSMFSRHNLIIGEEESDPVLLHNLYLSGVVKKRPGKSAFSRSIFRRFSYDDKSEMQKGINLVREKDINILVNRILEKVWGKE